MAKFSPPDPFTFEEPSKWPEWKERFMRFRSVSKQKNEDGEVQVSTLIYCMGRQAENIFKSIRFDAVPAPTDAVPHPVDPKEDFAIVMKKFDDYFVPKKNTIHERTKFYHKTQDPGESIESFLRSLYGIAKHCRFEDKEDEHLRDRFISGLSDKEMSKKLQLEQDTLTLDQAVQQARHNELVQSQNEPAKAVNAVRDGGRRQKRRGSGDNPSRSNDGGQRSSQGQRSNQGQRSHDQSQKSKTKCGDCGYVHRSSEPGSCPAIGKTCKNCRRKGHFKAVCRQNVQEVYEDDQQESDYFCGSVNCDDSDPAWRVTLRIGSSQPVDFKIDSGADVSVMSYSRYLSMKPRPVLSDVKANLSSPGGPLNCKGRFIARTQVKGTRYNFRVLVVGNEVETLLGRGVASRMGLIAKIDALEDGVGCLDTDPVKIVLKEDAHPFSVITVRRVSVPLLPRVKEELDRLLVSDVIREVKKPTPWCAPMVPVIKKSGSVRLCVDLKKLNVNVRRERFILPTLEDLTSKLSGATMFSCLDAASGFYQIPLDVESQELTTFLTPFGRYCFKRLPFGITSAPEIFMRKMMEVLDGVEGVFTYMDDVLIYGNTPKEHDDRLANVLDVLKRAGLKLNQDKCSYRQKELKFLGHIFSKDGISADPEKVEAISKMPPPSSVTQLKQVLGMVHYLGSYLPDLHVITRPLNDLLKADVEWIWGSAQVEAFEEMKSLISSTPVLAYYDVNKATTVNADSSSYGLGGVLLQDHEGILKPVAYCSRTLSGAEQRYAQIEKECLAGVWACEKFDRFLCGLESFTLETDHKPLVPLINSRDLDNTPLRCQRLLMRLMRYNAQAKYVPGKDMYVSDALSRSPMSTMALSSTAEVVDLYVQSVVAGFPASPQKRGDLRAATQNDSVLQAAIVFTLTGWPKYLKDVPESLHELYAHRAMLSVTDGLLVFGNRIVIPVVMRHEILSRIHDGHQGITKCLERARLGVWWPGLTADVKRIVTACEHCQIARPTQRKEPLLPTPLPQGPWQRVGADLCQFKGKDYLVLVDYYSRWIEVLRLYKTTAESVISRIEDVFARFGSPKEVISDNGPQFISADFKKLELKHKFNHITSSPYLPNANGEAERAVQTAKRILSQTDHWLGLMVYRDTPIAATGCSPSQLMLGRHIQTTLPVLPAALEPSWPDRETVLHRDQATKETYAEHYNHRHGVRPLQPLQPGESIVMKDDNQKGWNRPGVVSGAADTPRSYIVQTETGTTTRRNRRHLQSAVPTPFVTPKKPVRDPQTYCASPMPGPVETPGGSGSDSGTNQSAASATPELRRSGRSVKRPDRYIENN